MFLAASRWPQSTAESLMGTASKTGDTMNETVLKLVAEIIKAAAAGIEVALLGGTLEEALALSIEKLADARAAMKFIDYKGGM